MNFRSVLLVLTVVMVAMAGIDCRQKNPPRDQIPVIRERLARVQEALRGRNAYQIDSLLSSQVRHQGQPVDSLYRFIYGADLMFPFHRFADYDIIYNHDKARIDCLVSDSAGEQTRPITLTFVLEGNKWQLKRWEPRVDTTTSE